MAQWRITAADGRKFTLDAATDLAARYFAEQKGIIVTSVEPLDDVAAQFVASTYGSAAPSPGYTPSRPTSPSSSDIAVTLQSIDARLASLTEAMRRAPWYADRRVYGHTVRNSVMWGCIFAWLFLTGVMLLLMIAFVVLSALGLLGALTGGTP